MQYYSVKSLQHVKQSVLRPRISRWLEMQEESSLGYETVLVTLAQWLQPTLNIQPLVIRSTLDNIAGRILEHLHTQHPDHGVFKQMKQEQSDQEEFDVFKLPQIDERLEQNVWTGVESRQILSSTNHVLYDVVELNGNKEDYYCPDNSFINKILETKQGIPISLCLIYSCVVSRLGLHCLPVNFPGHFLLKIQLNPAEEEFTFIDAFARGHQMTEHQARQTVTHLVVDNENLRTASPLDVGERMLRNLISIGASRSNSLFRDPNYGLLRSSLEMMMMITQSDTLQYGFMLSRVYLQLNINQEEVMSTLQDYRDHPGIGDQVDYLMNACQVT